MSDDRFVEIEIKLSHQENMVEELNKVICQQQKKIDQLDKLCEALVKHIRELSETVSQGGGSNEKPPHY